MPLRVFIAVLIGSLGAVIGMYVFTHTMGGVQGILSSDITDWKLLKLAVPLGFLLGAGRMIYDAMKPKRPKYPPQDMEQ